MSVAVTSETVVTTAQEAVERFAAAINAKDPVAARACLTNDTVYETPDGIVLEGIGTVGAYWEKFIAASPDGIFSLDG